MDCRIPRKTRTIRHQDVDAGPTATVRSTTAVTTETHLGNAWAVDIAVIDKSRSGA